MKVVITGGGGFLGQVLAREIITLKQLRSGSSSLETTVTELILADIVEPKEYLFDLHTLAKSNGIKLHVKTGDVSNIDYCKELIGTPSNNNDSSDCDGDALSVFHLGAVMSGAPPDLALKVNLYGTINMLEATRAWQEASTSNVRPTFIFSSAGATLGSGHSADWVQNGDTISDATRAAPDVVVPIGRDINHAVTGYKSAIQGMLAIHNAMPAKVDELLGFDRTVFLPTRPVSLRQLEEAVKRVISPESVSKLGKVVCEEDEQLSSIVGSFPTSVDSKRSLALGAPPTPSIDEMIREYCRDFASALGEGVVLGEKKEEGPVFQPNVNRVVALVTGGGSGIGRQVAIRLSKGGWGGVDGRGHSTDGSPLRVAIVLAGRRSQPLEDSKKMCQDSSNDVDVLVVPTDVNSETGVEMLMNVINSSFGRIDLLFNNAGINIAPASVEEITSADFQKVMNTNVTACWRMAKRTMQIMAKQTPQGGRIINNGSVSSHSPRPGSAPYTISKHGVFGLTKCIALDGRKHNITCGQIDFGNVSSEMTKSVGGSSYSMSNGMPQANGTVMPEPTFSVEDAGNTVFAMAALPLGTNVLNMTVMASHMPYVGRG